MGALDGVFRTVADSVVKVFSDTPITLTRRSLDYDLATRTEDPNEASITPLASPSVPFQTRRVDGRSILATDVRVIVPSLQMGTFDPKPTSEVVVEATVQGEKLAVKRARRLGGDLEAAWELQLRA